MLPLQAKAEMKQFGELVYTVKKPSRIAASADFVALAVDKIEANVVELKFPKDKGSVLWLVTEILQVGFGSFVLYHCLGLIANN